MAESSRLRWRADAALVFVAVIWGMTFVVVKDALTQISTAYFLALRFSLAAVCLLMLFWTPLRQMGRRALLHGLAGGAITGTLLWLGYMLQTAGLKRTSAGHSGFLTGLYIVLAPLIGALLFRRRPSGKEILGVTLAFSGLAVMTVPDVAAHLTINPGDLLTIGCAVAFAFHLLVLGFYSQRERFEAVALGQIACTAVLCWLSLAAEAPAAAWNGQVVFAIALTGIFATAAAFALQTWAQQYTTATRTALIFALEPVVALATAVLIGNEQLNAYAAGGGALILGGIIVSEWRGSSS